MKRYVNNRAPSVIARIREANSRAIQAASWITLEFSAKIQVMTGVEKLEGLVG